jgi:general secretion pathway protein I
MNATRSQGFTLLEVLVAVAILGLGLTAILSAQTGLLASSSHAERLSGATGLLRCKMTEVELKLAKDGYPLVDQSDEGACCGDDEHEGFRCKWSVERVELPEAPLGGDLASVASSGTEQGGLGALGGLAAVGQSNGDVLGDQPQLSDVSDLLGSGAAAGGGTQGLAPLVMSLVYPSLKPLLEASIRKVVVSVRWKEGSRERDITATQFVTNPQQGGLDPNAAQGLDQAADALLPGGAGAAPSSGARSRGRP